MASTISPTPRQPVEATERKRLTKVERDAILARQHGRCAACPEPLVGVVEGVTVLLAMVDEHILPLDLAGSNDLSNRELRCPACAKAKTRDDIKRIGDYVFDKPMQTAATKAARAPTKVELVLSAGPPGPFNKPVEDTNARDN